MKFTDFGFSASLMEGIDSNGYTEPTPIQAQVIPAILEGRDVLGSAQTGTGKTAAFLLPIIEKIIRTDSHDHVNALIIVPTRELAIQIANNLEGFSYFTSISSLAIYGGNDGGSFVQEKTALSSGADIIISTPGRLLSHFKNGYVKVEKLEYLILDEADRMLDMGFVDDISTILKYLPAKRQNLMFSATMPHKIRDLAKKILSNPLEVNISISKPAERVIQQAFIVHQSQKMALIKEVLKGREESKVLIFCSRKESVKQLAQDLAKAKYKVGEIHSDLEQTQREQALLSFKSGRLPVLIATDILSRGIDIDDIDLVVNFDVPNEGEDYIHRIGRTARAQSKGTAITFVNQEDQARFKRIEDLMEMEVEKPALPESLGPGPEYAPKDFVKTGKKKFFKKRK